MAFNILCDEQQALDVVWSTSATELRHVRIDSNVWSFLDATEGSIYVSLAPTRRSSRKAGTLPSIIYPAILDNSITGIIVPSRWPDIYPHLFLSNQISVSSVVSALISEVFISALDLEAYQAAQTNTTLFQERLVEWNPILCQGTTYSVDYGIQINGTSHSNPSRPLKYRVEMLEPVLQGYVKKDVTRFHIILADSIGVDIQTSSDDYENSENIEIGEDFLANSVLHFTPHDNDRVTDASFVLDVLDEQVSHNDDETIYVRTPDLSRIGALNGDSIIVHSHGTNRYRLVYVKAEDSLVHNIGSVAASPLLTYNINCDFCSNAPMVTLYPSPFGSGAPAIPTAKSIAIARVASPYTINKLYEPLFLDALKQYFEQGKRLVKSGDLIAASIDTDLAQPLLDEEDERSSTRYSRKDFPVHSSRVNVVVHFLVTNVEHDVMPNINGSTSLDMYTSATIGELGCWVIPSYTRIVQAGIEHLRVPDTTQYLNLDTYPATNGHIIPGTPLHKLLALVSAAMEQHAVDFQLQLSIVLSGARGVGKCTTAVTVARRLGLHVLEINCYDILGKGAASTEGVLRARFDQAVECSPCILVLRNLEALVQTTQPSEQTKLNPLAHSLRECISKLEQKWRLSGFPIIVCGTVIEINSLPAEIQSCFKHEIAFSAPDELERYAVLRSLLENSILAPDVSIVKVATQTAALLHSNLSDLVARVELAALKRSTSTTDCRATDLMKAGLSLTNADFTEALEISRASYSESIGAPKIPSVSWDDVGGLATVKNDILDTIQLPLEHPELFSDGLKKRSGILLYGPPGTGKTLVAKAVATSFSLNFFSVKGPELLNMYIGESEANVRRVFQRARDAKPCVIFFDELDSIAPKRGNQGDSGGVMDRIVSQLLAELDGMAGGSGGSDVFVLGATNRPDLLDPALLRPGRFDRMLYLGVSENHDAQLHILTALTRKFKLDPELDLKDIADLCPFNYTGADFYALCSDALLNAMTQKAEELDRKLEIMNSQTERLSQHPYPLTPQYYLAEMSSLSDVEVVVGRTDFERALQNLVPSVSQLEMDHYANIQRQFTQQRTNT